MQLPSGMELVPLAPECKAQMDGYTPVAEYNKKVRAVFLRFRDITAIVVCPLANPGKCFESNVVFPVESRRKFAVHPH